MRIDLISTWWTCPGCGQDAELAGPEPAGCAVPCPDCSQAMMLCWEVTAGIGTLGRSAA